MRWFNKFWLYAVPSLLPWECWDWEGPLDPQGYARLHALGQNMKASWVSWLIHHGDWPSKLTLHACDNRPCTNFIHLFQGTHQDNTDDKLRKKRHDHRYSDDQIREVFILNNQGFSQRTISDKTGISQPHISAVLNGRFMKARILQ